MHKKSLALVLAAVMLFAGCSNSSGTAQTTTESAAAPSEAWDYEMYVEDLDYFAERYFQSVYGAQSAFSMMNEADAKKYMEGALEALNGLENVVYPPNLEETHGRFLQVVELQKELSVYRLDLAGYLSEYPDFTPEESAEYDKLAAKMNEILAKIENDDAGIRKAYMNTKNAAFSYIPNGEYKAYSSTLTILFDTYSDTLYEFENAYYNGSLDKTDRLYEKCINAISDIENIDTPEALRSYQDAVIEAIATDRNYCDAMKTMADLAPEYGSIAEDELPDEVKATVTECFETINSFYNYDYEAGEIDPLSEALNAAYEAALAQAGQ